MINFVFIAIIAETVQELRICLQHAIDAMHSTETPVTAIASGSELFLRFITLATLDSPVRILIFLFWIEYICFNIYFYYENLFTSLIFVCIQSFAECKGIMLDRGKVFYEKLVAARGKVAKVAANFITDGSVRINIKKHKIFLQLFSIVLFFIRRYLHIQNPE